MGSSKLKILSLGTGQINFLSELYGNIAKVWDKELSFIIAEPKDFAKDVRYSGDGLIDFIDAREKPTIRSFIKVLLHYFSNPVCYQSFLSLSQEIRMHIKHGKQFTAAIADVLNDRFNQNIRMQKIGSDADLFHVHFPVKHNLTDLWYAPKNKPVILSFWGSDLMRTTGAQEHFYQAQALERATIITLHSDEMKSILLKKFGSHLEPKVRLTLFSLTEKLFDCIDVESKKEVNAFKYNDKPNITIGHNGSKFNNQEAVLASFEKVKPLKEWPFNFILPFSYCPDGAQYKEDLKVQYNSNQNVYFLEEFLSWEALAQLRLASNYYIHVPKSDAMSAALTESIYAGAQVIVGDWLPYSRYDYLKIPLTRIRDFDSIAPLVEPGSTKSKNDKIKAIIRENLVGSSTAKDWVKIYKELLL